MTNLIENAVPALSIILAAGIVLYFDGLIFSGGKGWVKGISNAFTTKKRGFLFFLLNIVFMIIATYILQILIAVILILTLKYFWFIIALFISLLWIYYLINYTKKGVTFTDIGYVILFDMILFIISHLWGYYLLF